MNATLLIAGVGTLMLITACGSSSAGSDTSAPPVAETGEINYAEGAFIPSGSGTADGDPAAGEGAPSDAAPNTDAVSDPSNATTTTTGGDPDTAGSTSVPTSGGSAGASTSVPAGSAGATTTLAPTGSSPAVGEGIVRIGTVSYPFVAETCDVDEQGFFVLGYGTSSTGQPVEVDMGADTVDLDSDGTVDINFDIFVVPDVDAGVDVSNLPDFYASKVETAAFSEGADIVVTVTGSQISGAGPIEDFNGVAVPEGETLPMTFDVRCG